MSEKAKAPVIILVFLLVVSLALAGGGFYLLQKEKTKAIELQDKLDEITTKQRITENKLEESKKVITELQVKLQDATTKINSVSSELQQEKAARQEAMGKLEQLKADFEQQKALREDLESKFTQAQDEARKTQAQLKVLESQKQELDAKIKNLEEQTQGVDLGKVIVNPESGAAKPEEKSTQPAKGRKEKAAESKPAAKKEAPVKPQGLEGKVLVVNKDYNFVVINLGSKDGVSIGNVFSVFHGDKNVGDVKVEKVHESMAAAGFLSGDLKDKISEGDKVVQKGK